MSDVANNPVESHADRQEREMKERAINEEKIRLERQARLGHNEPTENK